MQKSDLRELKKTTKINKATISTIACCYVNPQGEKIHTSTSSFLSLDESDQFKYLDFLKKIMSCKPDDTLQTLPVEDGDKKRSLMALNETSFGQEAVLDVFFDRIIKSIAPVNGYCIILLSSDYDIPQKGSDDIYQDESDGVYSAIYGFICPMKSEKEGLYYEVENDRITSLKQRKVLDTPIIGFMYPDYNERCPEPDKAAYAICDKKNSYPGLVDELFGGTCRYTAKQQKDIFNNALVDAISEENVNIETISQINDQLMEIIEKHEYDEQPAIVNLGTVSDILVKNGVDKSAAEKFTNTCAALFASKDVNLENILDKKKKVYKNPDVTINVDPQKRDLVQIENRSGKDCIVISLDSAVEINGIPCSK